jgi:hypothetical protein
MFSAKKISRTNKAKQKMPSGNHHELGASDAFCLKTADDGCGSLPKGEFLPRVFEPDFFTFCPRLNLGTKSFKG